MDRATLDCRVIRGRPLPRIPSPSSKEVSVDFKRLYCVMRHACSSPVSGTDERMNGGKKKDVFGVFAACRLYRLICIILSHIYPYSRNAIRGSLAM